MPDHLDPGATSGLVHQSVASASVARPVRVFISYAHDEERHSSKHKDDVLALAEFLAERKIDVHLDRWNTTQRANWHEWTIQQITTADFVLAIASESYRAAAEGKLPPDKNRGAQHELRILGELLNSNYRAWFAKILPVVMPTGSPDHIPLFLQPTTGTYYTVSSIDAHGIDKLLRILTGATKRPHPSHRAGSTTHTPRIKRRVVVIRTLVALACAASLLIPAIPNREPLILNYSWPAMSGCDSKTAIAMPEGGPPAPEVNFHIDEDVRTTATTAGAASWHVGYLAVSLRTRGTEKIHIEDIRPDILRADPGRKVDWVLRPDGGCGPVTVDYTLSLDCPNRAGIVENVNGNPPVDMCTGASDTRGLNASGEEPLYIGIQVHSCLPIYYEWILRLVYFDESGTKYETAIGSREHPLRSIGTTPAAPIWTISPGERNTDLILRNTGQMSSPECDQPEGNPR